MLKSPFLFYRDLISPLMCEEITSLYDLDTPNFDYKKSLPIKTIRHNKLLESRLVTSVIKPIIPTIEQHYGVEYAGLLPMTIEWYPENCQEDYPESDAEKYIRNKWVRINDSDFTILIFLKDVYLQDSKENLDPMYEVYGGSLQFPNFNFSLNTQRGSAVVLPSCKNFAFNVKPPKVADQFLIKFNLVCRDRFKYDQTLFEPNYKKWLSQPH